MIGGGTSVFENHSFTKMAMGSVIVSLGFSIPSLIYESEKLTRTLQIFIHMGIGCTVMLIFVTIELAMAFLIWVCFSLYYRREARKINEQIHKLNL